MGKNVEFVVAKQISVYFANTLRLPKYPRDKNNFKQQ